MDPVLFERCAQDLLTEIYPGLSPVPGGTDWGRDADIHHGGADPPLRLMVTKSRDLSSIRRNMLDGLESLERNSVPFERIVLANLGEITATHRRKLADEAAKHGARLDAVFDRGFFASRLRRDGEWRQRLLGLSGDPITVSRIPWWLAEKPWSRLPLVGRDAILARLEASDGDVIVVGMPGVGKTRLLVELEDVVFVDPDAADDRLADDIRWIDPRVVVVDDVARSPGRVSLIQRLRRQEEELREMRLVVVCWPDQVDAVRDLVPDADEVEVDLLERSDIGAIVEAMGVTGVAARQAILEQAEGRPGWAVALADLLQNSGGTEIVTGRALLGQVDRYLRRSLLGTAARDALPSGSGNPARDVLGVIAALRGVDERDLLRLAAMMGVSRADVGRVVDLVAKGGFVDVQMSPGVGPGVRRYVVRPPMLAAAVATDHFLMGDVTLGDIDQLLTTWPERKVDVVVTVCIGAELGAERALAMVDELVDAVLTDTAHESEVRRVYEHYLLIDARRAARVVGWLRNHFEGLRPQLLGGDRRITISALEPLVELAGAAARHHLVREAVLLLLEMAVLDAGESNPGPGHPLRVLEDLCTRAHPDVLETGEHRALVVGALGEFLPAEPTATQWRVWAVVARAALDPRIEADYVVPEDPHSLAITKAVVGPESGRAIRERLWPPIRERLRPWAPTEVLAEFVGLVEMCLHVGEGHDRPFGHDHPAEAVAGAAAVGRAMFADLVELCHERPALAARLVDMAPDHDLGLPGSLVSSVGADPFFRPVGRSGGEGVEALRAEIEAAVAGWTDEAPDSVVQRLVGLRDEARSAGITWPDRVGMACEVLGAAVDEPAAWVDASLRHGLFPTAAPFVERLVRDGPPGTQSLLARCVDDASARQVALEAVLSVSSDDELARFAVARLVPTDRDLLVWLMAQDRLSRGLQRRILRQAPPGVQGAFALVLTQQTNDPDRSIAAELLDDFLAAVEEIRPAELDRGADYHLGVLAEFLASRYPDTLETVVRRRLEEAGGRHLHDALGHDFWGKLHLLPAANKTSLLEAFPDPHVRGILFPYLIGPDADLLEELVDAGIITPRQALAARDPGAAVPIDRLARMLVPRGVDPADLAATALWGTAWGELSERYERLVQEFSRYAESEDPNVAAVGRVGVEMFMQARDEARGRERQERIRGDL